MAKKTTLETLSAQMQKGFAALDAKIDKLDERMERGFAAVADDITDIKRDMATKQQLIALHAQVTSIEEQFRNGRYETRLTKLENEVFGEAR